MTTQAHSIRHHRGTPPAAEFRERDGGELRERPLAINQIAQTTLRNIVEQHSQDEVLAETSVINGSIREILDTTTVEADVEVTWSRRPRSAPGDHDRHFVTARLAGFYPATTPAGVGYDAPRSGTM